MKDYIKREDINKILNQLDNPNYDIYYRVALSEVKIMVNRLPAADVVEVVHGKWIGKISEDEAFAEGVPDDASEDFKKAYRDKMDHITHCSNCNGAQDDRDVIHYRYCPYCGTRMDKED